MDEILKRSHILILAAVIIGVVVFASRPTYAGGAFSEVPYAVKSTGYVKSSINKRKRAFDMKWKLQSKKMSTTKITGYEIQYARNSKFTKSMKKVKVKNYKTTSKKIKNLKKKKKYYVRIRTYMNVGGVTYYSKWSKTKSVKTK